MKTMIKNILCIALVFASYAVIGQNYDYLESATSTGTGTTNLSEWSDFATVTIDVTNITKVLITASINMKPDGHSQGRQVSYNIYNNYNGEESGEILRQIKSNNEAGVESWGLGTLIHVFDVSAFSGDKIFTLEHCNSGSNLKNIFSSARLTAIALTTEVNGYELSHDMKYISDEVGVDNTTYEAVADLTTTAIDLPIKGDILVMASINSETHSGTGTAEYMLEYTSDGSSWNSLGTSVQRSVVNVHDEGIISLVGLLQNQNPGANYQFRLMHRKVTGAKIWTKRSHLVAIALAHEGGGYFPAFYSEVGDGGVDIVGAATAAATVTTGNFTSAADIGGNGANVFLAAQYEVNASNLDEAADERMRAQHELYIDNGTPSSTDSYFRYIPDNSNFGSGGILSLLEDLDNEGSYTVGMKHNIAHVSSNGGDGTETLTTSNTILTGFQTYDQPGYLWCGDTDSDWDEATNWEYDAAPTSSDDICIPASPTSPAIINASTSPVSCNDLFLNSGNLLIEDDGVFNVVGSLVNSNGSLIIESTSSGTGSLIIGGTSTGTATVQRFLSDGVWHMVSPSTSSVTVEDFYFNDNPRSWIMSHAEADNSWNYITDGGEGLNIGQGYASQLSDAKTDKTISMTGSLRTTNLTPTISYSGSNDDENWNLIGNPFSSALLWDANWGTSNMEGSIWIWSSGNYAAKTAAATYDIPVGQGFFVRSSSSNPSLTISSSKRTHSTQAFVKSSKQSNYENIIDIFAHNNQMQDIVHISFQENGSTGFDNGWDASKLFGAEEAPQLYLVEQDRKLSYNHLPELVEDEEKLVVMNYIPGTNGEQKLIANTSGFFHTDVILEDIKTGNMHNFKEQAEYVFAAEKTDSPERFLLHFKGKANSINEEDNNWLSIYSNDHKIYIETDQLFTNENSNITIYNLLGQEIWSQELPAKKLNIIELQGKQPVVIIKATIGERQVVKKLIIK